MLNRILMPKENVLDKFNDCVNNLTEDLDSEFWWSSYAVQNNLIILMNDGKRFNISLKSLNSSIIEQNQLKDININKHNIVFICYKLQSAIYCNDKSFLSNDTYFIDNKCKADFYLNCLEDNLI